MLLIVVVFEMASSGMLRAAMAQKSPVTLTCSFDMAVLPTVKLVGQDAPDNISTCSHDDWEIKQVDEYLIDTQ